GAEPLFFLDYFSTSRIDPAVFARVVGAMADACAAHGCALIGGETAEMPGMYHPGAYDVAGFLVGMVAREAILRPASVSEGDVCIGLASSGLHTNAYTLARAIAARIAGEQGRDVKEALTTPHPELGGGTLGDALLVPHTSYLSQFRALRSSTHVRSIAHLTGGGWEGNLPRALPAGLGAVIDRGTWEVPAIFRVLAELGTVPEVDQWDTWNMGIGLVVIVPASDAPAALRVVPGAVAMVAWRLRAVRVACAGRPDDAVRRCSRLRPRHEPAGDPRCVRRWQPARARRVRRFESRRRARTHPREACGSLVRGVHHRSPRYAGRGPERG